MRNCSKCGSFVPDGKLFCVACGRPAFGAAKTHQDRISQERNQNRVRISEAQKTVHRENRAAPRRENPYRGNTYEQHKSHDPNSKDYYKSKYDSAPVGEYDRKICAAAYLGFLFFLPLVLLPNSKEGRFHANQGLVLLLAMLTLIAANPGFMAIGVFYAAYGIYNALQGEMKELPGIGKARLIRYDGDNAKGGRK